MTAVFPWAERISRVRDPLDWTPEKNRWLVRACREMGLFHYRKNPDIRRLYDRRGFDPASLRSPRDLERIPPLGVTAMKHFLMTTLPPARATLKLTSSGTRGQKTQIWFDRASLERVQAMLATLWEQEGLVSKEPANYLMFVYDPAEAKDLGIAFSDKNQQRFAPPARTCYAVRKDEAGRWVFRKDEAVSVLRDYAQEGLPVRLFGIPSFIHEFLAELGGRERIPLPAGSLMMTGGGWKAAEDRKVTRGEFREAVGRIFGLPAHRIRDGFGMAEHSAPYMDCARHRFHVPVYNRLIIRDPETMRALPPGKPGLLELITPFNAMMPTLALLSTDIAMLDPKPCPCGLRSPTFTLVGRGGLSKAKGCAIHAADIVGRDAGPHSPASAPLVAAPGGSGGRRDRAAA